MLRGVSPVGAVVLVLLAFAGTAQAAAPANDDFANATPLTVGEELESTNLEATNQAGEEEFASGCDSLAESPFCQPSVWYSFEAPAAVPYTIETCDSGTDLDTVLGVYEGSLGGLTAIAENDDSCAGGYGDNGSRVSFTATAGTTYHAMVSGFDSTQGSFYIRAYEGAPQPRPAPDTAIDRDSSFASAAAIFGDGSGVVSGSRHSASFALTSPSAGAVFECSLDGVAFDPCTTPVSYDAIGPGEAHLFKARAVLAGVPDPTPAVERFTIDPTPPETTLLEVPPAELLSMPATWRLGHDPTQNGTNAYLCAVDSEPLINSCSATEFQGDLCDGVHLFRAAAFDGAANVDPTPAESNFKAVTGEAACAEPTLKSVEAKNEQATSAATLALYENHGSGGALSVEYGLTAAYGHKIEEVAEPQKVAESSGFELLYLAPETTYHYEISLRTPYGTASSGDETFETGPLAPGTIPSIQNGAVEVVGQHAAAIDFEIDAHGIPTEPRLWIEAEKPVEAGSRQPSFGTAQMIAGSGPEAGSIQVVDLDPGVTYHYRVAGFQSSPGDNSALGPEGTFTMPKGASVSTSFKQHFVVSKKLVTAGHLRRGARKLLVKLHGIPAGAAIGAKLGLGHLRAAGHGAAGANGKSTLSVKFSKKFGQAVAKTAKGKLSLRVTVRPPNDTPSSVTLGVALKPASDKKPHKKH